MLTHTWYLKHYWVYNQHSHLRPQTVGVTSPSPFATEKMEAPNYIVSTPSVADHHGVDGWGTLTPECRNDRLCCLCYEADGLNLKSP